MKYKTTAQMLAKEILTNHVACGCMYALTQNAYTTVAR